MLTYKIADKTDTFDITVLVEKYCMEHKIPYNPDDIDLSIQTYLHLFKTIIAYEDKKALGAICFSLVPNPYNSQDLWGRKLAIYVLNEHQNNGVGYGLLQEAEDFCKLHGATKFFFSSPKTVKGYKIFETDYVKEL